MFHFMLFCLDLMAAADLFVLSSLSEGISVTWLEAMAAQLPIVATNVGGNCEVIVRGHNGWLTRRRSHESLADHVVYLLRNSDLQRRFGAAGHVRLLEHFTQEHMRDRYLQIYYEMPAAA